MDYPIMQIAEAIKSRTRYFQAPRLCRECGVGRNRYLSSWSGHAVWCLTCYPDADKMATCSAKQIVGAENSHNRKVRQKNKKLWCVPSAFSGLNTAK